MWLKTFFKRHALLMGLLAVAFPLLFILYLQYRSLVTLDRTLPVYRKQVMREYLSAVASDSASFYRNNAERVLGVPAAAITNRVGGVIHGGAAKEAAIHATTQVADYFKQQEFRGARRFFVVVDTEHEGVNRSAVLFYNPERNAMELDQAAPEWRAINVACAAYIIYIRADAVISPRPMGIDRDPLHPLIIKPILDESEKIVGVAGMTVDWEYFQNEFLPGIIQKHLAEFFPPDYQEVVVAVNDEEDDPIIGDERITKANVEASMPLGFIFQRWFLMMRMRHMTEGQWARRNFVINLSLWTVMTLFLIGGIVMTLRTASRAMKLSEMKSDFVSNVSHELRTPLASIRVFGEFFKLGRVKDPDKMREYGEYIETESRRLTQLINNILDFSRIESGQKSYHFHQADIREVVADTLKMFEVRLKQSEFVIDFKASPAMLPQVSIDSDAITQAIVNLLDNAVKYSGSAREISVRLAEKGDWITIAVTDRGIGIPGEDQERIFERFHRVSTGLVHDVRGSGLGLSIVKHIAEAHRGKVTVESAAGRGSTFTIHLPVEVTAPAKPETKRGALAAKGDSLPEAGLES
ncbi:MAG TPA: HAMP domain-containing sensor histidine kinase [Blastocatellia bacterium]|nr:HAMP domain-containing sensor histidine kinase [Blastocatellia bacterium]